MLNYSPKDQLSEQIRTYEYIEWIGWAIAAGPLVPIPLAMLYMLIKTCISGPGSSKWEVRSVVDKVCGHA